MADAPTPAEQKVIDAKVAAAAGATTDALAYDEPKIPAQLQDVNLESIWGNFPMVTGIPTYIPKTFRDSIALDSTTGKLYYYDFTGVAVWRTVGVASFYAGKVESNAASTPFPTGWGVVKNATGSYTITHNLGVANSPMANVIGNDSLHAVVTSIGVNSFNVAIATTGTDVGTDGDFTFHLGT